MSEQKHFDPYNNVSYTGVNSSQSLTYTNFDFSTFYFILPQTVENYNTLYTNIINSDNKNIIKLLWIPNTVGDIRDLNTNRLTLNLFFPLGFKLNSQIHSDSDYSYSYNYIIDNFISDISNRYQGILTDYYLSTDTVFSDDDHTHVTKTNVNSDGIFIRNQIDPIDLNTNELIIKFKYYVTYYRQSGYAGTINMYLFTNDVTNGMTKSDFNEKQLSSQQITNINDTNDVFFDTEVSEDSLNNPGYYDVVITINKTQQTTQIIRHANSMWDTDYTRFETTDKTFDDKIYYIGFDANGLMGIGNLQIINILKYDYTEENSTTDQSNYNWKDVTSYDITIGGLDFIGFDSSKTTIELTDIKSDEIEIYYLLSNILHLNTDGTTISILKIDGSDVYENILYMYKNSSALNTYADIYLVDESNVITENISYNLMTSDKTISVIDSSNYIIVSNKIDGITASQTDISIEVLSESDIDQSVVTQYHNVIDILPIFNIYNTSEYKSFSKNFYMNQGTLNSLSGKSYLIAEMKLMTNEMSLYRKKFMTFKNRTENLNTSIKIFNSSNAVLYDFTFNDDTKNITVSSMSTDWGKIRIYGVDFSVDTSYEIDFDISFYPFFIGKYSIASFSDKIVLVSDTSGDETESFSYSPLLDIVIFDGLNQGININDMIIFGGLITTQIIEELSIFGGLKQNDEESVMFNGIS